MKFSLNLFLKKFVLGLVAALILAPSAMAALNISYEKVITDISGREIGYSTSRVRSLSSLASKNPEWYSYLTTRLPSGLTVYEYLNTVSSQLSSDLNLSLSDRDETSFCTKNSKGYNICLFKYLNDFTSDSSKTFVVLHEFGHVVMLNSYPRNYNFSNLNYGTDGAHYLDEILPDANTAWVEGWANGFAAHNNGGKVFSMDLNKTSTLSFLNGHSFSEMTNNEVLIAKVLYDTFNEIPNGQNHAYDIISSTGPHYSLLQFCQAYTKKYPEDKAMLAQILLRDSNGAITLNELLAYVNNGSRTVSRELFNCLTEAGLVTPTSGNSGKPVYNKPSVKPNPAPKTSFWGRLVSFFKNLFGFDNTYFAAPSVLSPASAPEAAPEASFSAPQSVSGSSSGGSICVDGIAGGAAASLSSAEGIAEAQEAYYKAFAEYNALVSSGETDKTEVANAISRLKKAKERLRDMGLRGY